MRMAKETYRFLLRLPPALRTELVKAAERSGRSLNAELVHRIERSLDPWARARKVAATAAAAALIPLGAATGFLAVSAFPSDHDRSIAHVCPSMPTTGRVGAATGSSCSSGPVVMRDSTWNHT